MSTRLKRRRVLGLIGTVPVVSLAGGAGLLTTAVSTQSHAQTGSAQARPWKIGGTEAISVDYPDDSIFATGNSCTVSPTRPTTRGPCYFLDDTGEDISTGLPGLPMQLCLRLVDRNCQPLAQHTVEVWHCDTRGVYSGDTRESRDATRFRGRLCTAGDRAAQQSSWYRGKQVTNANGRVNFKTCFPGWYPGRTIHIHFAASDAGGRDRVISQFCFSDELARDICTTHALYRDRGEQDVPLASGRDGVFPSSGHEGFQFSTRQNPDGTLLAYHTIRLA